MPHDLTIRELQTNLPWSIRYSADFRATPMPHKDFAHALTHVHKAGGMLAALVDNMDHRKETADDPAIRENIKYLADLVICAMRMANTFPGGVVDLQRAVEDRLESKNDMKLPRPGISDMFLYVPRRPGEHTMIEIMPNGDWTEQRR